MEFINQNGGIQFLPQRPSEFRDDDDDGNTEGDASTHPAPFVCVVTTDVDDNGKENIAASLQNCVFYWEGEFKDLGSFDVTNLYLSGGTVFLSAKQPPASSGEPTPEWEWTICGEEQEAPAEGKVLNFKLYDFGSSEIKVDYRTTFLAMTDTTKKAKVEIGRTKEDTGICLDASGDKRQILVGPADDTSKQILISASNVGESESKIEIRCSGAAIVLDAKQVLQLCGEGGEISLRTMYFRNAISGEIDENDMVHFLGCRDVLIDMVPRPPEDGGGGGDVEGGEGKEITIKKGEDTNLWVNGNVNGAVGEEFKIDVYYS